MISPVISVHALAARLGEPDLRIVDARFVLTDAGAGRAAYLQSHLPGAIHADLNEDLSDLRKTGQGRHPLPDAQVFARRLGEWGITPQDTVVAYDAGDGSMAAARLWWLLKLLGHAHVSVLDGGMAAWRAEGLPETAEPASVTPVAPYPASFNVDMMVDAHEVQARLQDGTVRLIDARAAERFRGEVEPIDPVAGHVPGAVNLPFARTLDAGRFKPADTLRAELSAVLAGAPATDAVLMCGSGVTACHLLLAFEHAGLTGARIYPGSWSGWISDPTRPVTRAL